LLFKAPSFAGYTAAPSLLDLQSVLFNIKNG